MKTGIKSTYKTKAAAQEEADYQNDLTATATYCVIVSEDCKSYILVCVPRGES